HSFSLSSRRRHTSFSRDWSSDVCSSDLGDLVAVCPYHDPVRAHEVAHGPALAQELGVGGDRRGAAESGDPLGEPGDRPRGDGRLHDEDRCVRHDRRQLVDDAFDVVQIGPPVRTGWSGQAQEDELGTSGRFRVVAMESQAAARPSLSQQPVETDLVDRHAPRFEGGELSLVSLGHPNPMTEMGEAGAGDQADISSSDYCYLSQLDLLQDTGSPASAPSNTTASTSSGTSPTSTEPNPNASTSTSPATTRSSPTTTTVVSSRSSALSTRFTVYPSSPSRDAQRPALPATPLALRTSTATIASPPSASMFEPVRNA